MSCEVKEMVFAGAKTTVFICGPQRPRKKCRFCRCRDARSLCDYPVMKMVQVSAKFLKVGDSWITQKNAKHGKIVEVKEHGAHHRQFWVKIAGHKDPYPYLRWNEDLVTTLRPGTCDAPCCFRHRRHVGPDRDYCAAHWNSLEEVFERPAADASTVSRGPISLQERTTR